MDPAGSAVSDSRHDEAGRATAVGVGETFGRRAGIRNASLNTAQGVSVSSSEAVSLSP
jgi:hypothetical protein